MIIIPKAPGLVVVCLVSLLSVRCANALHDQKAITTVLETESRTWRNGDTAAHNACWAIKPYSLVLFSNTEGTSLMIPAERMLDPASMGKGGSSSNSNYRFSIHGRNAWVSLDEVSVDAAGKKSYSHEIKLLEKIHGAWKIVGQSIHMYKN